MALSWLMHSSGWVLVLSVGDMPGLWAPAFQDLGWWFLISLRLLDVQYIFKVVLGAFSFTQCNCSTLPCKRKGDTAHKKVVELSASQWISCEAFTSDFSGCESTLNSYCCGDGDSNVLCLFGCFCSFCSWMWRLSSGLWGVPCVLSHGNALGHFYCVPFPP